MKTALMTGASSGIGAATAHELAMQSLPTCLPPNKSKLYNTN